MERNNIERNASGLSRRSFITGAAAAGAIAAMGAVAGCAPSQASSPSSGASAETGGSGSSQAAGASAYDWAGPAPEPVTEFEETVDLTGQYLIVGAGMSGYAVATRLIELGEKVTLVAKTDSWTGIGGSVFAFNSSLAKQVGGEVDVEEALPRIMEMMSHNVDERLWRIFALRSGEAMDWACGICEEEGLTVIISEVEHGSLGEYPGTHNFAGGANCSFTTDKDPNSENRLPTTVGSPIMDFLPILERRCTEGGMSLNYSTTVEQLIKDDDGRVSGAVCTSAEGKTVGYVNARAVVLCTGDYTMDENMLKALCPMADSENVYKGFLEYATGDGQKLGVWAGAAMQDTMPHAPMIFSLPVECTMGQSPCALSSDEIRELYEDDPELLQRYQTADEAIIALTMSKNNLQVNANGERFNNEHCVMGYEGIQLLRQPGGKVFNIYTPNWMDYIPEQAGYLGGPVATKEDYALFMCPEGGFATIDELAEANDLPADTLKETIRRYNELCEKGYDEDFLKPAEYLCPIDENGPFYCIPTYSALLVCLGGLQTDPDLHVLDEAGEIIPGLYANGSVAGNFVGNNYTTVCPGLNFGRSLCFGYLLADYLSKNE